MTEGGFFTGDRLAYVPRYVFGGILVVTAIVFILAAALMGFQRAWEILTAIQSPFGKDKGVGFPLSVLGYVFVPTAIGLAVTEEVSRFVRRRLTTVPEARDAITEIANEAIIKHEKKKN
jgi:hypothetical protein